MREHPRNEELMAWHDREVPEPRAAEIAAHVASCAECTAELAGITGVSSAMQAWRIETTSAPPAAASRPGSRRHWYWAAAAAIVIGLLSTVRVECASALTCDHPRLHFAFLPDRATSGLPGEARSGLPVTATSAAERTVFERDWLKRKPVDLGVPRGDAKVVVVMFIDWQCPACRAAHASYLPFVDAINRATPGAVRVVMRDFPLNKRCNPNVPVEMHPAACEAAVAVRLAKEKNRGDEMIQWLFARQETLTPAVVADGAKEIAGITDFAARYAGVVKDLGADEELGRRAEIRGTPSVFVNGILARGEDNRLFSPQEFDMALKLELKR